MYFILSKQFYLTIITLICKFKYKYIYINILPIAMKLRFSWTLRQDTSVGLFPGMAGNIRVHRGLPLSFLSRFHTFTWWTNACTLEINLHLYSTHRSALALTCVFSRQLSWFLPEDWCQAHPDPQTPGCCVVSAGTGVSRAAYKPESWTAAGSGSKTRSVHPYVHYMS